ncbi:MAG: hypothetical protein ACRBCS_15845 [Cellvibrionaceae bacterium]
MNNVSVNEEVLKRVPMPKEYHEAVKEFASDDEKGLPEFYGEIIKNFILKREENKGSDFRYLVSPSSSKYVSLWINKEILDIVKSLAEADKVSANRVIYTAIQEFIEQVCA